MTLNVGPKADMHVNVRLLPTVVGHGVDHAKGGLAKLFEREVLVVDNIGFVMCKGRGDEGV